MKEIAAALVKAQRQFGPALKSSSNPHFKSKYADLAACVEAVIDGLNANGIALVQKQHPSDTGVAVETIFVHESGETFSAGVLTVPAAKQDPQGYGSALTYARRYSLMAACGIAPEDDDGNAARGPAAKTAKKEPAERTVLMKVVNAIQDHIANGRELGALQEYDLAWERGEEFVASVWNSLTTDQRNEITRIQNTNQKAPA